LPAHDGFVTAVSIHTKSHDPSCVTRDGNRFFVQPTEQRRIEIRAESDTDFFLIGVEASVTFGRADATGPVTHLILHQGGRSQTAERRR
jgi:hypothetical protein